MAGQIGSENVIGRDRLIESTWKKLQTESLRFTAERRIGKTTVMKKMVAEPKPGMELLFLDLEAIDSPTRFTEVLLTKMKPLLSKQGKAKGWFDSFLDTVGGTEIGGVIKIPGFNKMGWQATLDKAFEGMCSYQSDSTVVLLFDELPYMLQKIAALEQQAGSSDHAALAMLDTLRAMRHKYNNLRMVFAGSVGLHHVLFDLRGSKFASQPVNDMPAVQIHALELDHAITLAQRLIKNESVNVIKEDAASLPERLAILTDRVPFYLERVVSRLAEMDGAVSIAAAEHVVRQHLADDSDPWEMEHFRERLITYYVGSCEVTNGQPIENCKLARTVLDIMAVADGPQSIDDVWAAVKAQFAVADKEPIIRLLKSLAQDHYLISDTEKRYSFRFPLIKKWWVLAQGLSS